jgi:DNA-binding LacI/PurR family transcriptional regulator
VSAVEKAVDYLVGLGHKDIQYLSFSPTNHHVAKERCDGFVRGLKKNGIPFNSENFIIDDSLRLNEMKGTYDLVKKLFKNNRKIPTAFLVLADVFAFGLIKGLKELGLKIPKDVSVMGFDNNVICEYLDPPLTTIDWQEKQVGMESVNLLIDIIEGKKIENKNIFLSTEIVERKSVGPPRRN